MSKKTAFELKHEVEFQRWQRKFRKAWGFFPSAYAGWMASRSKKIRADYISQGKEIAKMKEKMKESTL